MAFARSEFASEIAARRRGPCPLDRTWRRDPRRFGRAGSVESAAIVAAPVRDLAADLRLFAITFLAGFIFVSILLA